MMSSVLDMYFEVFMGHSSGDSIRQLDKWV